MPEEHTSPKPRAPVAQEVPHIDLPGADESSAQPTWHVADDLPSFAKSSNVPTPIPPSQALTSQPAPPPKGESHTDPPSSSGSGQATQTGKAESSNVHDKEPATSPPQLAALQTTQERKAMVPFLLGGIVFGVIVLLAIMTVFFSFKETEKPAKGLSPQAAAGKVSPTPSPTVGELPKTQFKRASISFEVLNGSGVKGAGAAAAKKLTDAGYAVVSVGNGKTQVSETEVYLSASVGEFQESILKDVQDIFATATLAGTLSDNSTTASARLIVGKVQ